MINHSNTDHVENTPQSRQQRNPPSTSSLVSTIVSSNATANTAMTNSTITPRQITSSYNQSAIGPATTPPNLQPAALNASATSSASQSSAFVQRQHSPLYVPPTPQLTSPSFTNLPSNLSTASSPFTGHGVDWANGQLSMTQQLPFTINNTQYAFAAVPNSAPIGSKPTLMLVPMDQLPAYQPVPPTPDTPTIIDPNGVCDDSTIELKYMQQGLLNQYAETRQITEQQTNEMNDANLRNITTANDTPQSVTVSQTAATNTQSAPRPSRPTKPPLTMPRFSFSAPRKQRQTLFTDTETDKYTPTDHTTSSHVDSNMSQTTSNAANATQCITGARKRRRRRKKAANRARASGSDSAGSSDDLQCISPPPPTPKRRKVDHDHAANAGEKQSNTKKRKKPHRQRARKWVGNTLSSVLAPKQTVSPPEPSSASSWSTGWSDHPSKESPIGIMRGPPEVCDVYSSDESNDHNIADQHKDDTPEATNDENAIPGLPTLEKFKYVPKTAQCTQSQPVSAQISTDNEDIIIVHERSTAPIPKPTRPHTTHPRSCHAVIDPRQINQQPLNPSTNHNRRCRQQQSLTLPDLDDDKLRQQPRDDREQSVGPTPSASPASVADAYMYHPPTVHEYHPFAADLPAKLAQQPVQYESFEDALKRHGRFGHHQLNWRMIYYVMGHLVEVLSNGKCKVMSFDSIGQERKKTKSKICPYWPNCRACELKSTHIACMIGDCGIFHARYVSEPSDSTWDQVLHRNGNNKVMLDHHKATHDWLYSDIKRHLIWILYNNTKYIDNVLTPLVKNIGGRRKLRIRGASQNYVNLRGHFGMNAQQIHREMEVKEKVKQCELWLQELWRAAPLSLTKKMKSGSNYTFFRTNCPKRQSQEDRCCRLREDGRATEPQWFYHWDQAEYRVFSRYFCESHNCVKISCTHPELMYHFTESLTTPCFRFRNNHISTPCAAALPRTHHDSGMTYKALRQQMLTNYVQRLDRDIIEKQIECAYTPSIRRKALDRILPTVQCLTQILQDIQVKVYPQANEWLDKLMYTTTPRHFGIDQTFDELSKVTAADGTTLKIGCGTISTDIGYFLKWFLVNDNAENYDQTAKYAAEVKAKSLYYGDIDVLREHGITFSIDHIEKFQHLAFYIDHELEHNLMHNAKYADIAAKMKRHDLKPQDIITRAAECSMHLNRRKYRYAAKDGITSKSHSDFVLLSESETTWANSLQHADESMEQYPQNDVMKINGIRSDEYVQQNYGFLSATDVYWRYEDSLNNAQIASQWKRAVVGILQLEGHRKLVDRCRAQSALIQTEEYQSALPFMREVALAMHVDHVRQILGFFICGKDMNRVDTEWIRNYKQFSDVRGRMYAIMSHATLHHVAVTFMKMFGRDTSGGEYIAILQPHKDFISMQYDILKTTLRQKVYELVDKDTSPLIKYDHIKQAVYLAATPLSITGFVNNYNTDLSGVWVNVANERIHSTVKIVESVKNGMKKAPRATLNVEIKRYHANERVIENVMKDIPELFDDHFRAEFDRIKTWVSSGYFQGVEEVGHCENLSKKWIEHAKATHDLMNVRDIQRGHKKVTRKSDRSAFHRDIIILQQLTTKVSVDVLAYMHGRYSHGLAALCKALLRHGFMSESMPDGTLVVDPKNMAKIYAMIEDKKFKEIHLNPSYNAATNTNSTNTMHLDLPPVPSDMVPPTQSTNTSNHEVASNQRNRKKKRSDKEEMDESEDPQTDSINSSTVRLFQYESIGEPTDIEGVFKYKGKVGLHSALQLDTFTAASKAIDFINQQVPHVTLNKFIIDDLDLRDRSKRELIDTFKSALDICNVFGNWVQATSAKKIARYMSNESNWSRFTNFTGLSELDGDPIQRYWNKHKTQLGVQRLGANSLGNESIINPARRRREAASQQQDEVYLNEKKRKKNAAKWKQQAVFYEDYENYPLPFVQWSDGCKCSQEEVQAAVRDGNKQYMSWPQASIFEHELDECSMFRLHAMGTKQRKEMAEWHGYDKSKHGNSVGAAIDYLFIHHLFPECNMNEMTEEEVGDKLCAFFDFSKAIWIKNGKKFKKSKKRQNRKKK